MKTAFLLAALAACGGSDPPSAITFGAMGSLSGADGKGGFRFGAASAATQIEDQNTHTDWWIWTAPAAMGGMEKSPFVGDAARGYSLAMQDVQLVADMHLDSYRFSLEWARIEPQKGVIDESAIQHYRDELVALRAKGIRPLVTIHHFSNPVWVADPRAISCTNGPSDANLCGYGSPGGPQIVAAMAAHAGLVAKRFGDLVDEWGTENEPVNYLIAGYGVGFFPPGKSSLSDIVGGFAPVLRDYLAAHAAMYDAIKANDTIDADGDGIAASVGLSLSVADWEPAHTNQHSGRPEDVAARDRLVYIYHHLYIDSIMNGTFDANLDGSPDEQHPDWAGKLDWLGLQYYFRAGVTSSNPLFPAPISLTPCTQGTDFGSCLQTPQPTWCVPQMGYEFYADGIRGVLVDFSTRYPGLPLMVTESGIATSVGKRRAEQVVRTLESIARARDENGVDVRGFYEWSLTDNFEWAEGFKPEFGLYSVSYTDYSRTASEGADVLGAISEAHAITGAQRQTYGGSGAMTPDSVTTDPYCSKQ